MQIPSVPPSVNNAYVTVRNKRILTKAGRAYKDETKTYIARMYPRELLYFNKDLQYAVLVRVTLLKDAVFCKGFGTGKVESRYKKLDATNRIKLFEDALAEATGIDDQQNFVFTMMKGWSEDTEFTDVWIWRRYEESNPIDAFIDTFVVAEPQRALPAQPPRWP